LENISHIIKGCINKDGKCQKLVYEHYRGFALKIVFRYIYQYEKAVDVVNEGFVKLLTNFDRFRINNEDNDTSVERKLMGWLKKILVNACIDELRRSAMVPEIGGIPEHVWDIPDNSSNADVLLLYKELILLIKQLPPPYRVVFNLYVIDGFTHAEIAEMLNTSVGTTKSTLSRARALLQKSIRQSEDKLLCRI
jgi:RNA polymerase sigma factor (sigma-70 family)